jgi:transcriptional regulator with XRE-family HTH domain
VPTLRRLREERHLTQEQLAVAAEVSTSTVYHIEAGKVRPRPAILRRLARVLVVDPGVIEIGAQAMAGDRQTSKESAE